MNSVVACVSRDEVEFIVNAFKIQNQWDVLII